MPTRVLRRTARKKPTVDLDDVRKALRLSQTQVADKIRDLGYGADKGLVSRVENGEVIPAPLALTYLAAALGVPESSIAWPEDAEDDEIEPEKVSA